MCIPSDHFKSSTVNKIGYNFPSIKFVVGSKDIVKRLVECGIKTNKIILLPENKWFDMGIIKVKLEPLIHDVPNHCLKLQKNNKKMIYIVDTSNVDNIKAKGYDLYLIENNYREDILQEHLSQAIENNDENKIYYLQRTMRTHLSKSKCDSFLIENMGNNSIYEYVHLSKYNNTENGDFDK